MIFIHIIFLINIILVQNKVVNLLKIKTVYQNDLNEKTNFNLSWKINNKLNAIKYSLISGNNYANLKWDKKLENLAIKSSQLCKNSILQNRPNISEKIRFLRIVLKEDDFDMNLKLFMIKLISISSESVCTKTNCNNFQQTDIKHIGCAHVTCNKTNNLHDSISDDSIIFICYHSKREYATSSKIRKHGILRKFEMPRLSSKSMIDKKLKRSKNTFTNIYNVFSKNLLILNRKKDFNSKAVRKIITLFPILISSRDPKTYTADMSIKILSRKKREIITVIVTILKTIAKIIAKIFKMIVKLLKMLKFSKFLKVLKLGKNLAMSKLGKLVKFVKDAGMKVVQGVTRGTKTAFKFLKSSAKAGKQLVTKAGKSVFKVTKFVGKKVGRGLKCFGRNAKSFAQKSWRWIKNKVRSKIQSLKETTIKDVAEKAFDMAHGYAGESNSQKGNFQSLRTGTEFDQRHAYTGEESGPQSNIPDVPDGAEQYAATEEQTEQASEEDEERKTVDETNENEDLIDPETEKPEDKGPEGESVASTPIPVEYYDIYS